VRGHRHEARRAAPALGPRRAEPRGDEAAFLEPLERGEHVRAPHGAPGAVPYVLGDRDGVGGLRPEPERSEHDEELELGERGRHRRSWVGVTRRADGRAVKSPCD
jgi:hypothetical protein